MNLGIINLIYWIKWFYWIRHFSLSLPQLFIFFIIWIIQDIFMKETQIFENSQKFVIIKIKLLLFTLSSW